MLIDDIKKANIVAMKAHDQNARSVYSILIARYMEKITSGSGVEISDSDVLTMIQKLYKELEEEEQGYISAQREEQAKEIEEQKAAIAKFLPKQLSEAEIKEIINGLSDKALPAIMKYFKIYYQGKCDMSMVSKIARSL